MGKILRRKQGAIVRILGLSLLLLLATGGCVQMAPVSGTAKPIDVSGSAPMGFAAPFRCPPRGTTLVTTTGGFSVFYGAAPQDAEACLVQLPNRTEPRPYLFQIWAPDTTYAQQMRSAWRQLAPFTQDKLVEFTSAGSDSLSQWRFVVRSRGFQQISVPAGTFQAYVFEISEEGFGGNTFKAMSRWYFDSRTWVPVRFVRTVERGNATSLTWEARTIGRAPT
jgi:hypothetical protein